MIDSWPRAGPSAVDTVLPCPLSRMKDMFSSFWETLQQVALSCQSLSGSLQRTSVLKTRLLGNPQRNNWSVTTGQEVKKLSSSPAQERTPGKVNRDFTGIVSQLDFSPCPVLFFPPTHVDSWCPAQYTSFLLIFIAETVSWGTHAAVQDCDPKQILNIK